MYNMYFELTRDEDGKPTHVLTNDGFVTASRPFVPEEDGWMEDQLDPLDFSLIAFGRQMESLVREVNLLRREVFILKRRIRIWEHC